MDDWLKNLKKGDMVIVVHDNYHRTKDIAEIKRITPKGTIVVVYKENAREQRFRSNGLEIKSSDAYHWDNLKEPTPENLQSVRDENMVCETVRRMDKVVQNSKSLTVDQWHRIKAVLDESNTKNE